MKRLFAALCLILGTGAARSQEPALPDTSFQEALRLFGRGEYAASAARLEDLVNREPGRSLYWFNLGNARFMEGDDLRAETAYREVIRLGSPLGVPATVYLAKSLRRQGKRDDAAVALRSLDPDSLPDGLRDELNRERETLRDDFLAEALTLYRRNDFRGSIRVADAALTLGPLVKAEMLRGLAFLRWGRPSSSADAFRRALEIPARDEADLRLQREARRFLLEIEEGRWPEQVPLWLFTEVGAGYDTNVYGDSENDGTTGRPLLRFDVGFGYQRPVGTNLWLQASYLLGLNEVLGESEARFLDNALALLLAWDDRTWRVEVQGGLHYEMIGTDPFLWVPGAAVGLFRYLGSGRLGFGYRFDRNAAASTTYDYMNGNVHSANLHWRWVGRAGSLRLFAYGEISDTGDLALTTGTLPLAHAGVGPGFDFRWRFADDWKLEGFTNFLFLDYGGDRDDRQWNGALRLSFSLVPSLDLFASTAATVNDSTLGTADIDDKNFSQVVCLGGLSWNVLP